MLHDFLAQHLDFSLFVDVAVRVEDSAELDSDGALDLCLLQHFVCKFELAVLRDVVLQEVPEEYFSAFVPFLFELAEIFGPHLEVRLELGVNTLLLLSRQLLCDGLQLGLAELEPRLVAAVSRSKSEFEPDRVREMSFGFS